MRIRGKRAPYPLGLTVAIILFFVGIAGLFLPILQGLLLIGLALLILLEYHELPWLRKHKDRFHEWRKKRR